MRAVFFITTVSFCFYLGMGVYALIAKNERDGKNVSLRRSFSILCGFLAFWALSTALSTSAPTSEEAHFWLDVFAFAGFLGPGAFVVFSFLLSGLEIRPLFLTIIYLPGLLLTLENLANPYSFIQEVTPIPGGWHVVYADTVWYALAIVNLVAASAAAACVIGWSAFFSPSPRRKMQCSVVLFFFLPTFAGGLATGIIAPLLGIATAPPFAAAFFVIFVFGLAIALFRYGMLELSPASAAEGIFSGVMDAVVLVDPDGFVLQSNLEGGKRDAKPSSFVPIAADRLSWLETCAKKAEPTQTEFCFKPGTPVSASVAVRTVDSRSGEEGGFMVIAHDRSTQLQLEREAEVSALRAAALKNAEAKFSRVFMTSPAGMVVLEIGRRTILEINPTACKIFELDPMTVTGKRISDLGISLEGCDFTEVMDLVAGGETITSRELKLKTCAGTSLVCVFAASPLEFDGPAAALLSIVDVTEQDLLRRELFKAQKLESIGVMAGGIAHDFNNILTAVMGNISLARMCADDPAEIETSLVSADAACKRARELSRQLLLFSKGGETSPAPQSAFDIAVESVRFALSGSTIASSFSTDPDLPAVYVDKAQIGQVFANLALNAVQAMPNGGTLTVRAHAVEVADSRTVPVKLQGSLFPGRYVCVELSDTGEGIPTEHLSRIFDPYMTTKRKGTGLGLAISYSLVKRHNGGIGVESTPGEGSVFAVYLPAVNAEVETPTEDGILTGKGPVLVMDDELPIRTMSERLLSRLGYEVSTAANGEEAIDLFKDAHAHGKPFIAVLLDLTVIGGMGGVDAASILRSFDGTVPIFLTSGYDDGPALQDYSAYGFDGVIRKPYSAAELSSRLSGAR